MAYDLSHKNYHLKNRERILLDMRARYRANRASRLAAAAARYARLKDDPIFVQVSKERGARYKAKQKLIVLAHYGKDGKIQCCWEGCQETDLDVLSLDHINDNGAQCRKAGQGTGHELYAKLVRAGLPLGFQTLCFNHQFKKEALRRRANGNQN